MTDDVITRWTSRKFWASMIWQGVVVWLLYAGKIPVTAFESLTYLLLGGYLVGNVAQKYLLQTKATTGT